METNAAGHVASVILTQATAIPAAELQAPTVVPRFDELYDGHAGFVWRSLRALGVPERNVNDATQDVFVVVHRQLSGFEGRSSLKGWLFGIVRRVARDHRRWAQRKDRTEELSPDLVDPAATPQDVAMAAEAFRALQRLVDALDIEKKEVFIMADLEQMSGPEIAEALGVGLSTVYSRLRAARLEVESAIQRNRLREAGAPS